MKVLVAASSKHGATEEIARAIGAELELKGVDVTISPPDAVQAIDGFEAVVLGSAVYAGHWMSGAKEFVHRYHEQLVMMPVWLFSSGPIGDPPKPDEDPVDIADIVEATQSREHQLFSGRLERKRLGFAEKAIVIALRTPDGDFRDWPEIAAWADSIALSLRHELAPNQA